MNYRTDLAVELDEMLAGEGKIKDAGVRCDAGGDDGVTTAGTVGDTGTRCGGAGNITGYIRKQSQIDEDISVIDIEITDEEGERAFGKPRGRYVTLEVQGILDQKDRIKERAAAALADVLGKFIKHDYYLKVLVVGLGNEKVTPDSLGPHTVDKVKITSHLFKIFECDGDFDYSNVCGFNPSVTGITGLETADLIDRVVSLAKPDAVLAIDALAAKDIRRLSTTIQVCDTGIMPGAGMGNHRKEISGKTVGCPVICIGVPTVIDARTLILDAAQALAAPGPEPAQNQDPGPEPAQALDQGPAPARSAAPSSGLTQSPSSDAPQTQGPTQDQGPGSSLIQSPSSGLTQSKSSARSRDLLAEYLEEGCFDMIVTSTDIDEIIKDFADIISNAINITLHPGIYSKVK